MSKVLTLDAVLFGLLVFSGILGNMLVIYVVRKVPHCWVGFLNFFF